MKSAAKFPLSPELLSQIAELNSPAKRLSFLRKHSLFSTEAALDLNAATLKEMRVNTRRALAIAEAALAIARTLHRSDLTGQSLRAKANVVAAAGDYNEAIALYDSALDHFSNLQDDEGTARTLTALIQPCIMLGDYSRAFESAERAQKLLQKLGDQRRLARLENNIGNIYHRQDQFEAALAHYENAYQQLLSYGDTEELSISLNNMSMCLISLNDFPRALESYERAAKLLENKDLPLIRLINDYNVAYLYYLRGDYRRAIEMLKASRLAADKIKYTYLIALSYLDLSDIYIELNLSTEAQDVAEQGFLLFRELEIGYESAKSLANQAIALGQSGKTRLAIEKFAEARELFLREKNEVWPWLIDLYQALVLFHQGRYPEARRSALGASQFFDSSALKSKAALCHLLLSRVALRTGEVSQAAQECATALELAKELDSPILRYELLFLLGQVEHAQSRFAEAHSAYEQARAEIESLRSSLGRDELKISFMRNKTEIYERLVDLSLSGDLPGSSEEQAFHYIELAKSRTLTELMFQRAHTMVDAGSGGESELVHKIRDLREQLNWYQHRIELEQLRPQPNAEHRILELRSAAQAREKELLTAFREIPLASAPAALAPVQQQIPLGEVRSLLAREEAVLEYFFSGDQILAAILTRDSLHIEPLTAVPKVSEALRLLRFQLGKFQMPVVSESSAEHSYRASLGHLKTLYSELIAPIRPALADRHLTIVPHGLLHYLPFHALHDGENFLIDSHTISYAPSASVYALTQSQVAPQTSGALILGVPDPRAPLIRSEVESLHRELPESELHLGAAASHELFFRRAPQKRILHIATHGTFRPDNPMFSAIRLGDGDLYLYELFHLKLSADLLTLSGCGTGLSSISEGDELLGLARGALYAGARSLLLSLWDVSDHSTEQFMAAFYRQCAEGQNLAQAFAKATKKVRESHPHPYFWAPFLLVGKALSSISQSHAKN
ncbi:MAG TPA: CHAT domain-containing protein [Candidatus Acidoferrales bacterium]|nr:CHAT domain-containing protein [Candidatus Acidoferrales bacterium]